MNRDVCLIDSRTSPLSTISMFLVVRAHAEDIPGPLPANMWICALHWQHQNIHRWPFKTTESMCLEAFAGKEMPAANCDVSSESGRGRFGFLSLSPRGHTAAQVISQPLSTLGIWLQMASPPPSSLFSLFFTFPSCLSTISLLSSFFFFLISPCSVCYWGLADFCLAVCQSLQSDQMEMKLLSWLFLAHYNFSLPTAAFQNKSTSVGWNYFSTKHMPCFYKQKLCHYFGLVRSLLDLHGYRRKCIKSNINNQCSYWSHHCRY